MTTATKRDGRTRGGARGRRRDRLTDEQRRTIFGLGRSRGFDRDGLRELTPGGSIRSLTRVQADELIGRLQGRAVPVRRTGGRDGDGPTDGQVGMIVHLAELVGFDDAGLRSWLSRWFNVESPTKIADREQACKVIGALRHMQAYRSGLAASKVRWH